MKTYHHRSSAQHTQAMNQHSHITPPPGTYTAPNSAPNTHLYQIPTQPRKASSGKSYAHERSHIANQIQQEVQSTITTFEAISTLIDYAAFLLRLSQGPVTDRIDIRWWKLGGGIHEPTLIRWRRKEGVRNHATPILKLKKQELSKSTIPQFTPIADRILANYQRLEKDWQMARGLLVHGTRPGSLARTGIFDRSNRINDDLISLHQELEDAFQSTGRYLQDSFSSTAVLGIDGSEDAGEY